MRGKYKVGDHIVVVYSNHPRTNMKGRITEAANYTYTILFDGERNTELWDDSDRYFTYSKVHDSPLWNALK